MAERRMYAKTIVLSDAFLDMPLSARCLYFTLGMVADDDGFVNSPKSVMRQCGASDDDLLVLISKRFIICFETGVIVIKHWRINNYLQKDRYTETKYLEEKAKLSIEENGAYTDGCIHSMCIHSIGKDSIDKDSIDKRESKRFAPPTLQQVTDYCNERKNNIDPQRFIDYYECNGWMAGRNKMKDWKAAVRNWESREQKTQEPKSNRKASMAQYLK